MFRGAETPGEAAHMGTYARGMRSQTRRVGRVACKATRRSGADGLSAAVVIGARHPGASFAPGTYTRRALHSLAGYLG